MEMKEEAVKGIKESKELLKMLEVLADGYSGAMEDGKLGLDDWRVLLDMAKEYNVFLEAVKGVGEIPSEAKDYDEEELRELGLQVLRIVAKIKK